MAQAYVGLGHADARAAGHGWLNTEIENTAFEIGRLPHLSFRPPSVRRSFTRSAALPARCAACLAHSWRRARTVERPRHKQTHAPPRQPIEHCSPGRARILISGALRRGTQRAMTGYNGDRHCRPLQQIEIQVERSPVASCARGAQTSPLLAPTETILTEGFAD